MNVSDLSDLKEVTNPLEVDWSRLNLSRGFIGTPQTFSHSILLALKTLNIVSEKNDEVSQTKRIAATQTLTKIVSHALKQPPLAMKQTQKAVEVGIKNLPQENHKANNAALLKRMGLPLPHAEISPLAAEVRIAVKQGASNLSNIVEAAFQSTPFGNLLAQNLKQFAEVNPVFAQYVQSAQISLDDRLRDKGKK